MNDQELFWKNDYSRSYIAKNSDFDQKLGVVAWQEMLRKGRSIDSLLECGSNIGRNIGFLNTLLPKTRKSIIEISKDAFQIVSSRYELEFASNTSIIESKLPESYFDLVFFSCVLIHVHPDHLHESMKKAFSYSKKYILINEYFNRTPVSIEYQGHSDKLFKRDFGKLFMQSFDVKLVDYGFLWGQIYDEAGFDDTTWWLFEK